MPAARQRQTAHTAIRVPGTPPPPIKLPLGQRCRLHALCQPHGLAYARITNTSERGLMDVEVYELADAQILTPEQKKRVEPP